MDLSFRYENASTGKYLVLCLNEGVKVLSYQLNMLRYCRHPQILFVEKRHFNEKTELYYQINGSLPLRDFLKNRLKGDEVLNLLESLLRCMECCKKMFLYRHCFLLDIDYIFVQPETMEIVLVYLPLRLSGDVEANLRQFMALFIKEIVLFDNRQDLNTLKCLADYHQTDDFTLPGLQKLLNRLRLTDLNNRRLNPQDVSAEKPYRLAEGLTDKISTAKARTGKKEIIVFIFFQLVIIMAFLLLAKTLGTLLGAGFLKTMAIVTLTAYNVILINKFLNHQRSGEKTGSAHEKWHDYLVGELAQDKGVLLQEFDRSCQDSLVRNEQKEATKQDVKTS